MIGCLTLTHVLQWHTTHERVPTLRPLPLCKLCILTPVLLCLFVPTRPVMTAPSTTATGFPVVNPPRKAKRPLPHEFVAESSDDTEYHPDGDQLADAGEKE